MIKAQKQIWEEEHSKMTTLPSMASHKPASGVIELVDYLGPQIGSKFENVIDIGCGKGRNAVYLASKGCHVSAIDYIKSALEEAKNLAISNSVADSIDFYLGNIDQTWPFISESFDLAIDSFASIDIETLKGRKACRDEMYRTLKPNGLALVLVVSVEDEWEQELIKSYPGPEPNSTYWPQNGKFQKNYSEQELKDFYTLDGQFDVIELRLLSKPAFKLNKHYTSSNYWLLLKKL